MAHKKRGGHILELDIGSVKPFKYPQPDSNVAVERILAVNERATER